ncbi:hypothetical protein L596_030341 [Steinernema carpocapsae]|uniref:Uncharacterized protein n=1 Tax=Steinernema carpocapsae TaxID=34508 RepID=A0A4U5LP48_STECR|nr:hypothetical protein L596_030341 [Steinernema carpocapsae]
MLVTMNTNLLANTKGEHTEHFDLHASTGHFVDRSHHLWSNRFRLPRRSIPEQELHSVQDNNLNHGLVIRERNCPNVKRESHRKIQKQDEYSIASLLRIQSQVLNIVFLKLQIAERTGERRYKANNLEELVDHKVTREGDSQDNPRC